jgi:hypothetical protein
VRDHGDGDDEEDDRVGRPRRDAAPAGATGEPQEPALSLDADIGSPSAEGPAKGTCGAFGSVRLGVRPDVGTGASAVHGRLWNARLSHPARP